MFVQFAEEEIVVMFFKKSFSIVDINGFSIIFGISCRELIGL